MQFRAEQDFPSMRKAVNAIELPRPGGVEEALLFLGQSAGDVPETYMVAWHLPADQVGLDRAPPIGAIPLVVGDGPTLQTAFDDVTDRDDRGRHVLRAMPEDNATSAVDRLRDALIYALEIRGKNDLRWSLSTVGQDSLEVMGVLADEPEEDDEPVLADLRWAVVLAPMPDQVVAAKIVEHCQAHVALADYAVLDVREKVPAAEFRFRNESDALLFKKAFGGDLRAASSLPITSGETWPEGLRPVVLTRLEDAVDWEDGDDDGYVDASVSLRAEDPGSITVWNLEWQVHLVPPPTAPELVAIAEHIEAVEISRADYAALLSGEPGVLPAVFRFRHEEEAKDFASAFSGVVRSLQPQDDRQAICSPPEHLLHVLSREQRL